MLLEVNPMLFTSRRTNAFIVLGLLLLLLTTVFGVIAQETTPEPPVPTLEPTLTATPTPTWTETATLTPLPTLTATNTETPSLTPPPTLETTAEVTAETTATLQPTITLTPETTLEVSATPTTTEAPQLPLLHSDNFDFINYGAWFIQESMLVPENGGSGYAVQFSSPQDVLAFSAGNLGDVSIQARFAIHTGTAYFSARHSGAGFYAATLDGNGQVNLYRSNTLLGSYAATPVPGQWRFLEMQVIGDQITVTVDGVQVIQVTDTTPLPAGTVNIFGDLQSGYLFWLDDITISGSQNVSPTSSSMDLAPLAIPQISSLTAEEGKIVFVSTRGGNYDLWQMDEDGSNPVQLTNDPALDSAPQWSPDGQKIIFYSNRDGNSKWWVREVENNTVTFTLLPLPALQNIIDVDYSRDGSLIAITHTSPTSPSYKAVSLFNPSNGNTSLLVDHASEPMWSPDGTKIYFIYHVSLNINHSCIGEIVLSVGIPNIPSYCGSGMYLTDLSPDGTLMTFRFSGVIGNISVGLGVRPPMGGTVQIVIRDQNTSGRWSPDGTKLIFSPGVTYTQTSEIYVVSASCNQCLLSAAVNLTNNSAHDYSPDWWGPSLTCAVVDVIAAQQGTNSISVDIGVDAQRGEEPNNLYVNVYKQATEVEPLSGELWLTNNGDGYPNTPLPIRITGRYLQYKASSVQTTYIYRVEFDNPETAAQDIVVGWITAEDLDTIIEDAIQISCPSDPSILPDQDRDGTPVYPFPYTNIPAQDIVQYLAPITGNPRVSMFRADNDSILRVRTHAENPASLSSGSQWWIQAGVWENGIQLVGWIFLPETPIPASALADFQSNTPDETSNYGGRFVNGPIPQWQMPSDFTHFPISAAAACSSQLPFFEIHGLGWPHNPDVYPQPGFHNGVDFFAPVNASVFSISDDGLVVGIGIGQTVEISNDPFIDIVGQSGSAAHYGAAGVEEGQTGYTVLVRYGHLYVLYGHLKTLEPQQIFVGAPLAAGDRIGTIGQWEITRNLNSPEARLPHLHLEILNFDNPVPQSALYQHPNPNGDQFGFVTNSIVDGSGRPNNVYDVVQFFDPNGVHFYETDSSLQTSATLIFDFNHLLANNGTISIPNGCSITYRGALLPIVNAQSRDYRGYRLFLNVASTPVSPDLAPTQP
jgi:murein DD-endopeptidase MepM/ murein hydrolase activator NlpD